MGLPLALRVALTQPETEGLPEGEEVALAHLLTLTVKEGEGVTEGEVLALGQVEAVRLPVPPL
jgi:hypothetical protein